MALKSGLASQFGLKKETTPGTGVTVTNFQPLVSESMTNELERLEAEGIIAGRRFLDSTQWNGGNNTVGGDVALELYDRGMGPLWEACLGGHSVTGSGPYEHVFVPGDLPAYTVQIGRPDVSGTVRPFTYAGSKAASWELACEAGSVATFAITWVSMSETTGTALASASYTADRHLLKFNHGSVEVGGTVLKVKSATVSGDNGLDVDRRFLGSGNIAEPLEAGLRMVEGTLEVEFTSLAEYTRYIAGDELALELAFTLGDYSLLVESNIRYDGATPNVGGKEIVQQSLPFKAIGDGTDASAITVTMTSPDATI